MKDRVECRKGDPCSFMLEHQTDEGAALPIPDRYTEAVFQVRDDFDETLTLQLEATQSEGITIDHSGGIVNVDIGATKTEAINVVGQPRVMAAQLRLYDPTNEDDCLGWPIPFIALPEVIND